MQLSRSLMDDLLLDSTAKGVALCILSGRAEDLDKRVNVELSLFKRSMNAQEAGTAVPNIRPAMAGETSGD